jgi:hypothetical protein
VSYAFLGSSILPDSQDVKFPQVATSGDFVSVSGNANRNDAYLWQKGQTALSFSTPNRVGTAAGQPDYATTHLTYAPNGSLYYLWSNADERRIYMSVRTAGSVTFGPAITVAARAEALFPSHFDAVARSDNTLFLFWRDAIAKDKAPIRYMIVTVSGNVPAAGVVASVDERTSQSAVRAVAGPSGQIAVGYTLGTGNAGQLQAHIAIWNGTGFTLERISEPNGAYVDPMPVITPDGKYVATYRGDDTGTNGTWYAERQTDGSWPPSRLYKGRTDWSTLVSDAYGNLHLFWISEISGSPHLYYQVKQPGQAFDGSPADAGAGTYFNVDGNVSISDRIYGHAVLEDFNGTHPEARYFLFSSDLPIISVGSISIDGGQQYTKKTSLPVSFTNVVGDQNAMDVRYHWGSAPTSADAFVKFANPLSVAAPALANPSACTTQTLYTQIRVGSAVQLTPNQASIIFDTAAQATVSLVNPNSAYDPAFTASPTALLSVDSQGECIGLSGGAVSGDITTPTQSLAINGNRAFQTTVNLTGTEGLKTLTVNVSDLLGNSTGDLQKTITYDATKPVLTSTGVVTVTADPANPESNIFARVEIRDAALTEAGGLFGLIIQNQTTPTGGSPVAGTPIIVPFSAIQSATEANGKVSLTLSWSLLSGIPLANQLPGAYSFTAYFVDKAGNRSDQIAAQLGSTTLATINLVKMRLPLIWR